MNKKYIAVNWSTNSSLHVRFFGRQHTTERSAEPRKLRQAKVAVKVAENDN